MSLRLIWRWISAWLRLIVHLWSIGRNLVLERYKKVSDTIVFMFGSRMLCSDYGDKDRLYGIRVRKSIAFERDDGVCIWGWGVEYTYIFRFGLAWLESFIGYCYIHVKSAIHHTSYIHSGKQRHGKVGVKEQNSRMRPFKKPGYHVFYLLTPDGASKPAHQRSPKSKL
jgi:hypothetical protein